MIYLLLLLVPVVFVLWTWFFAKKQTKDTVQCFTGSLGTGKTFTGVSMAVKSNKKYRLLYAFGIVKMVDGLPMLYSNIPIRFKNGFLLRFILLLTRKIKLDKFETSQILKYEHITLVSRLKEYTTVFIDELGQFANQYSHDNPFVMQYLQKFVRFFRHFIDGKLIFTDQASDNITKPIRSRIGIVHNLSNFRRFWLWFYKVDVIDIMLTEDIQSIQGSQLDDIPYYFGYVPFKWFKFLDFTRLFTYKKYESRCYLPLYDGVDFLIDESYFDKKNLFTNYVIDLPNNAQMKKDFKQFGFISKADMMKYYNEWQKNVINDV